MKIALEKKSSVLASNAIHHRVDSLTGIVTLFAILGANFLHNAAWLDPVGGLLISLLVIKAGWGNTISALYELADKSIDEEVSASVRNAAEKSFSEMKLNDSMQVELRDVTGVKSGQNYLVDMEVAVPRNWNVGDVRELEESAREAIGARVRGVRRIKFRFVPKDVQAVLFDEFISGDVEPNPDEHDHDHDDDHSHANGNHAKTK